ncbi:MAG: 50S ribosome-binding GTPase [Burkholderiaceae bacterium]|nr:50S ribosome-binding GTPase [Burkholderiaceae bacterium]
MSDAATISLSLVSHTNVGKTTLARTLLGRDIGIVRDEAHVTESAEEHTLVRTPQGDRLVLWDTPGFGDSARLARRLESAGDPIGWFAGQVWDRFRDRALWASQQAVRNVRERADVVLYLVNASEPLAQSRYIEDEMRVLDWIGKPVIVLLNQLGAPRPASEEAAELDEWRRHLSSARPVRAVLPLDAFARCWVQEATLLRAIADVLPAEQRAACRRLIDEWLSLRRRVFDASIDVLAQALARIAADREPIRDAGMFERLRDAAHALARAPADNGDPVPLARRQAMRALAQRLDEAIRSATDRLIGLHGLGGRASAEIIERLSEHYRVSTRLPEGRAAVLGGVLTGALAGLKADLATGGFSFGAGILGGSLLGAMGAFGLARGYNLVRGGPTPAVAWSDAVLDESTAAVLLSYLAVAHYGRGRGDWSEAEYPPHWRTLMQTVLATHHEVFEHAWSLRGEEGGEAMLASALRPALTGATLDVLARLYPTGARDSKLVVPDSVHDEA